MTPEPARICPCDPACVTPRLLREDPDWLWLAKPAGLPVFPPHTDPDGPCLLAWLLQQRPEQDQPFAQGFAGGLAHRLDVSTSGVVLAARSPEALAIARAAFSEGRLQKHYRFVTDRDVPWDEHHVTTPVAHHKRRRGRMVVQRGANTPHRGKWYPADTRFLRTPVGWEATIRTGVTHQVRVHAAWVGLPIVGDRLYGGAHARGAPDGVRFLLHHLGFEGLVDEPVWLEPPTWWAQVRSER